MQWPLSTTPVLLSPNVHSARKMSPTAIQKQRSRELIEATWGVVARCGVENATVRDIAREAGCTTGALWHHFRNRDDLIDQAIDQLAADFFDEAEREWATVPRGVARLRVLIRRLAPSEPHQRDRALVLFRLWSRASTHPPTADTLRTHRRRLFELVVTFIEEAKQCAQIVHDVDSSQLAEIVLALGDGMCVSRVLMFSEAADKPDTALDTVLERFGQVCIGP